MNREITILNERNQPQKVKLWQIADPKYHIPPKMVLLGLKHSTMDKDGNSFINLSDIEIENLKFDEVTKTFMDIPGINDTIQTQIIPKIDIYSIGITLNNIFPFIDKFDFSRVSPVNHNKLKQGLRKIILNCVNYSPLQRINFTDLLAQYEQFLTEIKQ